MRHSKNTELIMYHPKGIRMQQKVFFFTFNYVFIKTMSKRLVIMNDC